jgi:hypothetical protein
MSGSGSIRFCFQTLGVILLSFVFPIHQENSSLPPVDGLSSPLCHVYLRFGLEKVLEQLFFLHQITWRADEKAPQLMQELVCEQVESECFGAAVQLSVSLDRLDDAHFEVVYAFQDGRSGHPISKWRSKHVFYSYLHETQISLQALKLEDVSGVKQSLAARH